MIYEYKILQILFYTLSYKFTFTFYTHGQSCCLERPRRAGGTRKFMTFNQDKCKVLHLERKNVWNDIGWRLTGWGKALWKKALLGQTTTLAIYLWFILCIRTKEKTQISENFWNRNNWVLVVAIERWVKPECLGTVTERKCEKHLGNKERVGTVYKGVLRTCNISSTAEPWIQKNGETAGKHQSEPPQEIMIWEKQNKTKKNHCNNLFYNSIIVMVISWKVLYWSWIVLK